MITRELLWSVVALGLILMLVLAVSGMHVAPQGPVLPQPMPAPQVAVTRAAD